MMVSCYGSRYDIHPPPPPLLVHGGGMICVYVQGLTRGDTSFFSVLKNHDHILGRKIRENSQSRGLKWPQVSRKKLKNLHE